MNVSLESRPPFDDSAFVSIGLTPAGAEALASIESPEECDICRRMLQKGDAFFRVTLGMDDVPSHVGAPLDRESTVEETSELVVCEACEPAVAAPVEKLLAELWSMRKPDPVNEDDTPTAPIEPPLTERST